MTFLRSLAFTVFLYLFTTLCVLIAVPAAPAGPRALAALARGWSRGWLGAYRIFCGVSLQIHGVEHLPAGGCIVAMKHQSTWDTLALFAVFKSPVYVLKYELTWIPLFGWLATRLGCIPVKRGTGKVAVDSMIERARKACASGRQVVIFPEGTRSTPGVKSIYKSGVSYLYQALDVPCVPVALNSGLLWPRRKFLRPAGIITVEILPPIPHGLPRLEMFERMVSDIETASQRLGTQ